MYVRWLGFWFTGLSGEPTSPLYPVDGKPSHLQGRGEIKLLYSRMGILALVWALDAPSHLHPAP